MTPLFSILPFPFVVDVVVVISGKTFPPRCRIVFFFMCVCIAKCIRKEMNAAELPLEKADMVTVDGAAVRMRKHLFWGSLVNTVCP